MLARAYLQRRQGKIHAESVDTRKDRKAASFTRDELQQYLFDEYVDTNKMRTAHKIHLTLRCIFDLIEDDLGIPSPMKKVIVPRYTSKHGRAFTYDEERQLVDYCITHLDYETSHAFLVLLYTGMRRSELAKMESSTANG